MDACHVPHNIGKREPFLQQMKHFYEHEPQRNGVLDIKHCNIYNCTKAAGMAIIKIQIIQNFLFDKSHTNCKIVFSDISEYQTI